MREFSYLELGLIGKIIYNRKVEIRQDDKKRQALQNKLDELTDGLPNAEDIQETVYTLVGYVEEDFYMDGFNDAIAVRNIVGWL